VRSPYTGGIVANVSIASAGDVDDAIAAASNAFPVMRKTPGYVRSQLLRDLCDRLGRRSAELAQSIVDEAGKPIKDARVEVRRALTVLAISAEEAKRIGGELLPFDHSEASVGKIGVTSRFPIGPVAAITPFNFPINLAMHKIGPALACGATVVWKPSLLTPGASTIFAEVFEEVVSHAGIPPGALNVVTPRDKDAEMLACDPRIKVLSFTGSARVGWALRERAGTKKVTLELGGNAAAIVAGDADLEYAVRRCVAGGFGYAGQTCISVQRILIEEPVYEEFVARLVDAVAALQPGDPRAELTVVGPMISEKEAARLEEWINLAVQDGAQILVGGERSGPMFEPTVVSNVPPQSLLACAEAFGPVVTVAPFSTWRQALDMVNETPYGLQAGVFTRDINRVFEAFRTLEVGAVVVGDIPTFRDDSMPYGGVKESGSGREGVRYAIEEFTEPRLLVLNLASV